MSRRQSAPIWSRKSGLIAYEGSCLVLQLLRSPEAARGATLALIVVVAGLVGQYAARGMSPRQWAFGIAAIAGSIALAMIVRCWPETSQAQVRD
jgi:hypothetical protein